MSYEEFMNEISGFYGIPNVGKAWELYKQSQRALWLTRVMRANDRIKILKMRACYSLDEFYKWKWVERKCLQKAEEFK